MTAVKTILVKNEQKAIESVTPTAVLKRKKKKNARNKIGDHKGSAEIGTIFSPFEPD